MNFKHFVKWAVSAAMGSKGCEMGRKAGSFYRIQNKKRGREKQRTRNKEMNTEPRVSLGFGAG